MERNVYSKKACIIGTATAVAAPLAIVPVLGVVGFTSAGVAAGSIAASMQTATTAAGSFFALCQSAGAVGAVATTTSVGVGLAAGATAGSVTVAVCSNTPRGTDNDVNGQAGVQEEEDSLDVEENDVQPDTDELSESFSEIVQ